MSPGSGDLPRSLFAPFLAVLLDIPVDFVREL
jgi:hypothetical protein